MAGGGGLMIAIGKEKPSKGYSKPDGDEGDGEKGASVFGEYADDVFDALKDDDREAFAAALKKAIDAC